MLSIDTVENKFLEEDKRYSSSANIADDQKKFYVIEQSAEYQPFIYLTIPDDEIESFSIEELPEADAILFKFTTYRPDPEGGQDKRITLWAYQKIRPSSLPNLKKQNFTLRTHSNETPDVFDEMTDRMFQITHSVDLLVFDDEIITEDVGLMSRHFGLEVFIRASGRRAVKSIVATGVVSNVDMLE